MSWEEDAPALLPRPLRLRRGTGAAARFADGMTIAHDPSFRAVARWFRRELEAAGGWDVHTTEVAGEETGAVLELRRAAVACAAEAPERAAGEAYELVVSGGRVVVTAAEPAGAFYGLQTLRQLLPADAYRTAPPGGRAGEMLLEPVEIEDAPRFSWRGVHLDVCRHFMPKGFVMKLVDLAAMHKCNVVHLHLTEDQGWRVPVAKYPRLIEVGAWRRESPVGHRDDGVFDATPHGGFYSREDLKEIVAFAAERHVTVLPEVDMPGHMVAAIAAYPELGNTDEPVEVLTEWGISDHVLNLEESTIQFCCDVIDEVAELFPGSYFHVGGDECPTKEWEASPRAAALMAEHNLTSERELQGWFTARIAEHLERRGRMLVGWDEILEGGAPPGALVMSWRGEQGGIEAAAAGHDVVMCPQEWLYLDWAYADDPAEPVAIRPATSVERVWGYEPVPDAIPPDRRHHVLGTQCQLWTEYVPTPERAEYQYFPRLSAFAEMAWSRRSGAGFPEFERRLRVHLTRLSALGVNYRPLEGPTPGQARTWTGPRMEHLASPLEPAGEAPSPGRP
ncbi:MAG TPA: beta-N-acetylhexosaminidase [Acidimicrobiales bacterium]|nr:beta-N-acetylhexosaminidase [Acidimicrobiales bacterium]